MNPSRPEPKAVGAIDGQGTVRVTGGLVAWAGGIWLRTGELTEATAVRPPCRTPMERQNTQPMQRIALRCIALRACAKREARYDGKIRPHRMQQGGRGGARGGPLFNWPLARVSVPERHVHEDNRWLTTIDNQATKEIWSSSARRRGLFRVARSRLRSRAHFGRCTLTKRRRRFGLHLRVGFFDQSIRRRRANDLQQAMHESSCYGQAGELIQFSSPHLVVAMLVENVDAMNVDLHLSRNSSVHAGCRVNEVHQYVRRLVDVCK